MCHFSPDMGPLVFGRSLPVPGMTGRTPDGGRLGDGCRREPGCRFDMHRLFGWVEALASKLVAVKGKSSSKQLAPVLVFRFRFFVLGSIPCHAAERKRPARVRAASPQSLRHSTPVKARLAVEPFALPRYLYMRCVSSASGPYYSTNVLDCQVPGAGGDGRSLPIPGMDFGRAGPWQVRVQAIRTAGALQGSGHG